MSFQTELSSWFATAGPQTSEIPKVGSRAPSTQKLELPSAGGKPAIISFLRHCGCPFAEKAFLELRTSASIHPNINFIAVSHSSTDATSKWQSALPPMPNDSPQPSNLQVIVDGERELFARWGLGIASFWHVLSPGSLYTLYRLAADEGIRNRPTESGSRWQVSGNFAVDGAGVLRWGGPAERADHVPDFEDAVKILEGKDGKKAKL